MCGIVYVKRKDGRPAYKAVLKRYRNQKTRGQQGYGYVAIQDNKIVSYQRTRTEGEIVKLLEKETAPEILFHHRMPTSTPNIAEANHPIIVEHEDMAHAYIGVHNGVIRNHAALKKQHDTLGFKYMTSLQLGYIAEGGKVYLKEAEPIYNDSESLMIEVARALEGADKIDTEGSAAVVILQVKDKYVLNRFFFRNLGNPLMFSESKEIIELTSVGAGKLIDNDSIYRLRPGGGFEPYGEIIPPPSYASYTYNKNFNWSQKDDKETVIHLPASTFPKKTTTPNIGFARDLDSDDDYPDGRRMNEILEEIDKKGAVYNTLQSLTMDELHNEWYRNEETCSQIEERISEIDELVNEGTVNGTILLERENLQKTLDESLRMGEHIMNEVNIREAQIEFMSK